MKCLNIHTARYQDKLSYFAAELEGEGICVARKTSAHIRITLNKTCFAYILEALLLLLFEIALTENPVYRHSSRLRELAFGLHESEKSGLEEFIRTTNTLNLEGYVLFRMEKCRIKLDLLLYKVMKKINSSNH